MRTFPFPPLSPQPCPCTYLGLSLPSPLSSDAHHQVRPRSFCDQPRRMDEWVGGRTCGAVPSATAQALPAASSAPPLPADHLWVPSPRTDGRRDAGVCGKLSWGACSYSPRVSARPGPPPPSASGRATAHTGDGHLQPRPAPRWPRDPDDGLRGFEPLSPSPAPLFLLLLLLSAPPRPARSAPPGAAPPGTGASVRDGGLKRVSEGRSETQRGV